jgi:3'(2'), 5'-bisphosphate nucleotidase
LNLAQLAEQLTEVARHAGAEILKIYAADFTATRKADQSPVTEADVAAEAVILAALRRLTPDIPVIAEEQAQVQGLPAEAAQRFWLVDPLDGTKEFVARNGEFTVNIALIDGHDPVLGVVHVPVTETTYTGARGAGATRQIKREPAIQIRTTVPAPTPLRIVGSRSHRDAVLDRYLPRLEPYQLVAVGSSIKFCLVAEGSADFYPRFGPTSEWDTAAAQAVVEAAGGRVIQTDGQRLRYNAKAEILNPHFLVSGDPTRDWLGELSLND